MIAEIQGELDDAQDQLEAQKTEVANALSDLQSNVSRANSAFDTSHSTLRADQQKRAVAGAAIVANLNAEMRALIMPSVPSADRSTSTDRLLVPTSALFAKNSTKPQESDGVKLNEIAVILKDTTTRVPEGIEWMDHVDSYGTGSSEEA